MFSRQKEFSSKFSPHLKCSPQRFLPQKNVLLKVLSPEKVFSSKCSPLQKCSSQSVLLRYHHGENTGTQCGPSQPTQNVASILWEKAGGKSLKERANEVHITKKKSLPKLVLDKMTASKSENKPVPSVPGPLLIEFLVETIQNPRPICQL